MMKKKINKGPARCKVKNTLKSYLHTRNNSSQSFNHALYNICIVGMPTRQMKKEVDNT